MRWSADFADHGVDENPTLCQLIGILSDLTRYCVFSGHASQVVNRCRIFTSTKMPDLRIFISWMFCVIQSYVISGFSKTLIIYTIPGSRSRLFFECFCSVKTIVLVRVYNQQFQGNIILMVFDFQGND